ncbi:AMP-binding protein [Rhodopila sp.]|uniref:AMP-binding protein n=1 Tax=Rhodopila sp. TaxID=2480087 RepID=UPI002D070864|nr:AMP-binding protein [Rhodopila sp.]HVZ08917.1 AMP-binding protein [Rhodopila sp.]
MLGLNLDCKLLLSTVIDHAAANYGDTEVVSCGRAETVRTNYRATAARARRLASALSHLGLGPGGFVGSLAWNTHRHFELFYGVSGCGGVLHTANPRLPPEQVLYAVNFTGYRTLFIDLDTVALAEQLAPGLETVSQFVVMAQRDAMPDTALPNVLCYEDLIDSGDPGYEWADLDERTACSLCFTSGTTGKPKGVLYSHRGNVLSALSSGGGNAWAVSADDAILGIPGFFHCNGWAVPFLAPMYGAKLVLPGRRADDEWLHRLIVDEGITVTAAVPTIFLGLLDHCRRTGQSLGRLQRVFSGGTAPPAEMIDAYLTEFGIRFSHGWGMTETTHGSTVSFAGRDLPRDAAVAAMRTQGKPLYGNQIRIVDDEDNALPHDGRTSGHLQCRGHWIAGAYFRQPEVDLQTPDGWMRTGDIATIDADNTLHIIDRAKDVIKSGGEWISSQALEEAATRHPAIREAAVVAMAHPRWQERPFLIAVTPDGAPVPHAELRDLLLRHVPKWWLPDCIAFVADLPHGPTGKLQKEAIRRQVAQGVIVPVSFAQGAVAPIAP